MVWFELDDSGNLDMKYRSGFVSNSSSMSFCIDTKEWDNVAHLAATMILIREWGDQDTQLVKKLKQALDDGLDPNTSLCFNTSNYETYLANCGSFIAVSTCNNHMGFWNLTGKVEWDDSHLDILGVKLEPGENASEEMGYNLKWISEYYYIETGFVGKVNGKRGIRTYERCKKHFEMLVVITEGERKGQLVCPICERERIYNENVELD